MLRELWFNLLFDIYILHQCIFAYRGGGGVVVNNFFQNVCSILPTNLWKFTNEILIETCWLIHLMTFNVHLFHDCTIQLILGPSPFSQIAESVFVQYNYVQSIIFPGYIHVHVLNISEIMIMESNQL